ncbi:hypothetical protein BASA61_004969 [Batrachochytrium salamandrivorans]|nr:hypothetical protein BASA61_004969 [Batrachochytrium salamandrivorans]
MVKVFLSNIDTPLGHNLARLLSNTIVGSRREEEADEDEEDVQNGTPAVGTAVASSAPTTTKTENNSKEGDEKPNIDDKPPKDTYEMIGTLHGRPDNAEILRNPHLELSALSGPAQMVEVGDKKKDTARREAIEKMSMLGQKPKWVKDIINNTSRDTLQQALISSDVIIYDITKNLEEASWAIEMISEKADTFVKPKTFIAVSSIMTWTRTKVESDDGEGAIPEDEYRRRKPHPNWKDHLALEKKIIKLGKKSNLKAYVVVAGLIYHAGDSIFHSLLKLKSNVSVNGQSAWHNEPYLPCFGDGSNFIPTIHLDDLISIIIELVETSPETRYLVAIDESKNTLYDITKAISESMGSGIVKKLEKENAFLNTSLSQADYDMLTVNLKIESSYVKEMLTEWKYESGLIDALPTLIQEFKDARGLWPLKIVMLGPPASGKSTIAQKIVEHYKLHLIDADQVVKEAMDRLERRISGVSGAEEKDDDVEMDIEVLNEIKEAVKANNGEYPTHHVINFVKEVLQSMRCRNQGYVLDGFPTTLEEAKQLFKANGDDTKDDKGLSIDELIAPEFVFIIEANDQFVKQRIMRLPEAVVSGTKNSEEALLKRLEEYRKINTDETTVLNYFDEQEIHPITLAVESIELKEVLETVTKKVGGPRNYGPSAEEIGAELYMIESTRAKTEALAAQNRLLCEKEETSRREKALAEWNMKLDEVRKQEQEVLEAQSLPLRNYLMKYVMPTLTAGLIEVAKIRPEDPIDCLAEFLFKVRMK